MFIEATILLILLQSYFEDLSLLGYFGAFLLFPTLFVDPTS